MENIECVIKKGYIEEEEMKIISQKNKDYIISNWEYVININSGKGYYLINNSILTKCDYNKTKIHCQLNRL